MRVQFDAYLRYDEDEGIYHSTIQRVEAYMSDLENGTQRNLNDFQRQVLVLNLKQWSIKVKNFEDQFEKLQILITAATNFKFDPFILNMRVLLQQKSSKQAANPGSRMRFV